MGAKISIDTAVSPLRLIIETHLQCTLRAAANDN
jgi:hypothetical protein